MKAPVSTLVIVIAVVIAVGGYVERVPTWADLLLPHYVGGFLKVIGGVILAGLMGSPLQPLINKLNGASTDAKVGGTD